MTGVKKSKQSDVSKSKNIRHIKPPNYFEQLKDVTKWFGDNTRTIDQLNEIIKKYEIKDITLLWSRIISLCYSNPIIIKYINKYLNNLYDWNTIKSFDLTIIFTNIAFIMDLNNHNKTTKFYFLKSSDEKDANKQIVKDILFKFYLKNNSKYLNKLELNNLYKLFNLNEITTEQINTLNKYLDPDNKDLDITPSILNKQIEIVTDDMQLEINNFVNHTKTRQLTVDLTEFSNNFKFYLSDNNNNCKNCELKNSIKILLDTNISNSNEYLDLLFINFQSGYGDVQCNKPLSDDQYDMFRQKLFYLIPEVKWAIINLIPCYSNDKKVTQKNSKLIIQNCFPNFSQLLQKFRSEYIIPIGKNVFDTVGLKGSLLSKSGQIDTLNNQKFLCLIDPISLIKYKTPENTKAFNNTFNTIYNLMNKKYNKEISTPDTQSATHSSKDDLLNKTLSTLNFQNKNIIEPQQTVEKTAQPTKQPTKRTTQQVEEKPQGPNFTVNIRHDRMIENPTDDMTLFDISSLDDNNILLIYTKNGKKFYSIKPYVMPIFVKNKPWYECDMFDNNVDEICYITNKQHKRLKSKLLENLNVIKNNCIIK